MYCSTRTYPIFVFLKQAKKKRKSRSSAVQESEGAWSVRGERAARQSAIPVGDGRASASPMWYRFRRLNVPLRQTVFFGTAATGASAVVVGTGWMTPTKAHMAPGGGGLASATGRIPEWGSEHVHAVRADWACIGANKASEDRLVVAEAGGGVLCAVYDGHYGPRASEFCREHSESYFAKVRVATLTIPCPFKAPSTLSCTLLPPLSPCNPLPHPILCTLSRQRQNSHHHCDDLLVCALTCGVVTGV